MEAANASEVIRACFHPVPPTPLVELSNANRGGLIDGRTIRDLPLNGRSWDNLALREPGIVKYGSVSEIGRAHV